MPTFTDEELREHEEKIRNDTRAQLEEGIIKDTSWKSLDAVKESAVNADKRINEAVNKEKETSEKVKTLEAQLEEVKKEKENKSVTPEPTPPVEKNPEEILSTITDKERTELDAMLKSSKELQDKVSSEGKKGMAEILESHRKTAPKEPLTFSSLGKDEIKTNNNGTVDLDDIVTKARDNYRKRNGSPVTPPRSGSPAPVIDNGVEERPTVKSGGGMKEFAADAE